MLTTTNGRLCVCVCVCVCVHAGEDYLNLSAARALYERALDQLTAQEPRNGTEFLQVSERPLLCLLVSALGLRMISMCVCACVSGFARCLCHVCVMSAFVRVCVCVPYTLAVARNPCVQVIRAHLDLCETGDERLSALQRAHELMSRASDRGTQQGHVTFPAEYVEWLVATGWNQGANHARFGRYAMMRAVKIHGCLHGTLPCLTCMV